MRSDDHLPPPARQQIRLGSCGQVLRGCEVKIEKDEILARGPNVMQGYYGRPEETAAILRDGWIHTGDLGRIDAEGFLYVTGRAKEILVLPSGKKVNPVPIEAELAACAGVREAGVFLDGETLHALVVADLGRSPTADRADRRGLAAPRGARSYNATRGALQAGGAGRPSSKASCRARGSAS